MFYDASLHSQVVSEFFKLTLAARSVAGVFVFVPIHNHALLLMSLYTVFGGGASGGLDERNELLLRKSL